MEGLLVTGSAVTVRQRASLRKIDKETVADLMRLESYGDLWGEHSVPIPAQNSTPDEAKHLSRRSSKSKLFASVSNHKGSIDLLGIQQIKIDVDIQ